MRMTAVSMKVPSEEINGKSTEGR